MPPSSRFRTSVSMDLSTHAILIMFKYDKFNKDKSGAGGKLVEKLFKKKSLKKPQKPEKAIQAIGLEKYVSPSSSWTKL